MPDPVSPFYLGWVEKINVTGHHGRIRPLALVKKRSEDGGWVVDRRLEKGELGESDCVFWFNIPDQQLHLARQYIRFKVKPNLRTRDQERERWDEFVVAGDDRNGSTRPVDPLGFPAISDEQVEGPDRVLSPSSGVNPGMMVFRRRKNGTLIDGPWRVAEFGGTDPLCLRPKEEDHVVEYDCARMGPGTYHDWVEGGEARFVLLVEPARDHGRPRDLLSTSGLAGWLIRVLRRDRARLSCFDQVSPDWKDRLGEALAAATDPVQKKLEEARFKTLGPALNALAANEARLNELVEEPRFKAILDRAMADHLNAAKGRIEAVALEETRDFVDRLRRDRELEKAQAEIEKNSILRELDEVRSRLEDAKRLRDESREEAKRDESAIREAVVHLVESRQRIIRDFTAFHGLIETNRSSGTLNGSSNNHDPVVVLGPLEAPPLMVSEITPVGPPIDESRSFLKYRLVPTLAAWGAQARPLQARKLHAALLACRWVAIPCPSWGVAYTEAIGAYARHQVVPVEATWLAFSDAWKGEVEAFWLDSLARPGVLHLLIFADADRALVQCWARPLLDIASGLRPALPSGHRWPDNLRVMVCPSADDAAWHVPDWVVAHWAGVEAAQGGGQSQELIVPGHVPFSAWASWVEEPDAAPRPSAGLGAAARGAAKERSAVARTFERLKPGGDPDDAEREAGYLREGDARSIFARTART